MIVVDTNVLAYLWIPGPLTDRCAALLQRDPAWMAPPLWRSELRNVLANHLRAGLTTLDGAMRAMEGAEAQMASTTVDVESEAVLRLAADSGCSAYDCEFVALAHDVGIPLVTADRKLRKSFPGIVRTLDEMLGEDA